MFSQKYSSSWVFAFVVALMTTSISFCQGQEHVKNQPPVVRVANEFYGKNRVDIARSETNGNSDSKTAVEVPSELKRLPPIVEKLPPIVKPTKNRGPFLDPRQFLVQENESKSEAKQEPVVDSVAKQDKPSKIDVQLKAIQENPFAEAMKTMRIKPSDDQKDDPVFDPFQRFQVNAEPAPEFRQSGGIATVKTWESPNVRWRPLYFEEENLERYGNHLGRLQPAVSGFRFVTNTVLLPYQLAAKPPRCCEYGLRYYRPGNCNPADYTIERISPRGTIVQGLFTVGILVGL